MVGVDHIVQFDVARLSGKNVLGYYVILSGVGTGGTSRIDYYYPYDVLGRVVVRAEVAAEYGFTFIAFYKD